MTDLEKTLQKRSNITFFREDKVPERLLIEEIVEKAHTLTPHKNNLWHYEIEIYGPEYEEEKKYTALSTVCNARSEDFEELEKIYDLWLEEHKDAKTIEDFKRMREKFNRIHFNNQVRAPYLLVYTKRDELLTDSQKKSDYYQLDRMSKYTQVYNLESDMDMWLIQSGMHSILTSTLAVEKGLDASFCKCFEYFPNLHSNILRKAFKNSSNIAFLLGLGYKDESKHQYKSYVPKPTLDEIVKWQG